MENKIRKKKKEISRESSRRLKPTQVEVERYKIELRSKPTESEEILNKCLKKLGLKFTFQKAFYNLTFTCIVDFYFKGSSGTHLIVEVDGGYHFTEDQERKDRYRTKWLVENRKCRVIRFSNEEVLSEVDRVIKRIASEYLSIVFIKESTNYKIFTSISQ